MTKKKAAVIELTILGGVLDMPPPWMPEGLIIEVTDHDDKSTTRYENVGGEYVVTEMEYKDE
jgi:hypothetical protein